MLPLPAAGAGATGDTAMSSTQHQLIEQCATRLRGIVEALDNIHDTSPQRWSTDLDDVHSSAESLLAMIEGQAPARSEASFEEWLANELEGEDGQPVPTAVCDIALARRAFNHWPKLEQPAKVGGVRFSAGVSSRLVVEAAQRLYEFESTPEKEAERIERLQAFREQLDPLNLAPHAKAFNEAPAEALKSEQAEGAQGELERFEAWWATSGLTKFKDTAQAAWQARAALAQPSPDAPYADGIAADLERSEWTPEEALRWYAQGNHFDAVGGRTRIIDTGAIASNALKHLSLTYLEMKGDAELTELREANAQPSPVLPSFAEKVLAKLRRFNECAEDPGSGGVDIGRHWLDLLTQLGLLNRVQRSPALWGISQQGEDLLGTPQPSPAQVECIDCHGSGFCMSISNEEIRCPCRAPIKFSGLAQAEQAEAERPEVVGVRYEDGTILSAEDCGTALEVCAKVQTPLMTVAQHERIVGELRFERQQMDRAFTACINERDAALANVDALAVQVLKLGGTISFAHHRTDQAGQVPQAWLDVQAERRRQVEAEGWTPEHDDEHSHGELADAAACYALWAGGINPGNWREFWPWAPEWLKHSEPRRMLVKAAALILAEIERLDRAAASQGGPSDA